MIDMIQWARSRVIRAYLLFWSSENAVMVSTAALVGVGAGMGAVFFRWLIGFFRHLAFGSGASALGFLGAYHVILIPAIGGLGVGPMVYFFAREAKGHGVPEVMEAVALRGGRIRPVVAVIKSLASSLCIGSGGSVGREGPIVQIGSALGSTLGQLLRFSDDRTRTLLACGAAGGISATFNAPIAGVFFALEVILREFSSRFFSMVVVASVTSSIIGRAFMGDASAFLVPTYSLVSPWELAFYTLLGLLAAFVALTFVFLLYRTEDLFDGWNFPEYLKPVAGGLGVGIIGVYAPEVFGVGYETIEDALQGTIIPATMLTLIAAKLLATSLTLGSGGSGGVFAPSLFLGAALGGSFGDLLHRWMPNITASPGAYALVGMAALFSGAARAPMTAVIILFEMTGNYRIILPLMFATVVSTLVAGRLSQDSIYTLKLRRRGVDIDDAGRDLNLMRSICTREAMTPASELVTVKPDTSFETLAELFRTTHSHGFAITDDSGDLAGIVALSDLEGAIKQGQTVGSVRNIWTTRLTTAYPDESLEEIARKIASRDIGRIPVVSRLNRRSLLGMVRRADIIQSYNHALMKGTARRDQLKRLELERVAGAKMVEYDLHDGDTAVNRKLADLIIPQDCLIISIRREGRIIVPRGETKFMPGDHVVALAAPDSEAVLRKCLRS